MRSGWSLRRVIVIFSYLLAPPKHSMQRPLMPSDDCNGRASARQLNWWFCHWTDDDGVEKEEEEEEKEEAHQWSVPIVVVEKILIIGVGVEEETNFWVEIQNAENLLVG